MYLKKLELKNFQCYDDTTIEFSPFLNCIVGRNNQGKTSLVRALNFLFYNEWDNSFIRKGEAFVTIKAVFDNGFAILREKGATVNVIKIKSEKGVQSWQNFGTEIPAEVQRHLGMYNFYLGLDQSLKLNISEQLDKPFLVLEPDGTKAKAISRLAQLHFFDLAISELNKESRNASIQLKKTESDYSETLLKLEHYKNIDTINEKITELKQYEEKAIKKQEKIENLDELLTEYNDLQQQNTIIKKVLSAFNDLKSVKEIDDIVKNLVKLNELSLQYSETLDCKFELDNATKSMQKYFDEKESLAKRLKDKFLELKLCPFCGSDVSTEILDKLYK